MRNVTYIEVEKLKPFENHPYYVKDDDEMMNLTQKFCFLLVCVIII